MSLLNYAPNQKDFYKVGHIHQYPEKTETIYSNFTARSGKHSNVPNSKGIWFVGLQFFIREFLIEEWNSTFFNRPKELAVTLYKKRVSKGLNKDVDVSHLEALHDLGYLPLRIKALPEGSFVPYGIPMFTIVNTLPEFYWLTNDQETVISAEMWLPITSATSFMWYRQNSLKYSKLTCDDDSFVPYQNHDFSMRGMQGRHAAAISGFAALACGSLGTDTVPALDIAEYYYGAGDDLLAGSVDATEHSVMCAGGKETEYDTYHRLISKVYPEGIVSIVSDTWDFWKVVTETLPALKDVIMARDGKVVIRPDSGDPVKIVVGEEWVDYDSKCDKYTWASKTIDGLKEFACDELYEQVADETPHGKFGPSEITRLYKFGDKFYNITLEVDWNRYDKQYYYIDGHRISSCVEVELTPPQKGLIQCLWETFGGTVNQKGFRQLDPHIGAIYGDSINPDRHDRILKGLMKKGFASNNIVFGEGSYNYGYVSRDTHGIAIKSTWAKIDGKSESIFKDPKTDDGTKKSARGLLMVTKVGNEYQLVDDVSVDQERHGCLQTVFEDGKLVKFTKFSDILKTVDSHL